MIHRLMRLLLYSVLATKVWKGFARTYKRSSNKLCEVTSAILYQEFKRAKNENYANSYVKPVEGNENNKSPQKISCNQCHGILEEHLILLSTLTLSVS